MKAKKPRLIEFEDLTAKVCTGKFGEYMYRSPYWGYKRAYRYNKVAFIYLTAQLQTGPWLDILHFKNANRREILEAIKNWKATSRKYYKAIS